MQTGNDFGIIYFKHPVFTMLLWCCMLLKSSLKFNVQSTLSRFIFSLLMKNYNSFRFSRTVMAAGKDSPLPWSDVLSKLGHSELFLIPTSNAPVTFINPTWFSYICDHADIWRWSSGICNTSQILGCIIPWNTIVMMFLISL